MLDCTGAASSRSATSPANRFRASPRSLTIPLGTTLSLTPGPPGLERSSSYDPCVDCLLLEKKTSLYTQPCCTVMLRIAVLFFSADALSTLLLSDNTLLQTILPNGSLRSSHFIMFLPNGHDLRTHNNNPPRTFTPHLRNHIQQLLPFRLPLLLLCLQQPRCNLFILT